MWMLWANRTCQQHRRTRKLGTKCLIKGDEFGSPSSNIQFDSYSPGQISCEKKTSTRLMKKLIKETFTFLAIRQKDIQTVGEKYSNGVEVQSALKKLCWYQFTRLRNFQALGILKWGNFIGFAVGVWMFSKIAHYQSGFLDGLYTTRTKKSISERIVFAWIFMSCSLYLSFTYTAFTDIYICRRNRRMISK